MLVPNNKRRWLPQTYYYSDAAIMLTTRKRKETEKKFPLLISLKINYIYIQSNEIHNVVALIKFLLGLRCQPYMFRTVTVHPQELLVDTVCADYGMC